AELGEVAQAHAQSLRGFVSEELLERAGQRLPARRRIRVTLDYVVLAHRNGAIDQEEDVCCGRLALERGAGAAVELRQVDAARAAEVAIARIAGGAARIVRIVRRPRATRTL